MPTGWLSQEVMAANKEAQCRGISPRFGALWLTQEMWVLEQPVPCLPLTAQVWIQSQRVEDSFLPTSPCLRVPHPLWVRAYH